MISLTKFLFGAGSDLSPWSHLSRREWLLALLAFVSVLTMYMINPWVHLHPQVWGDLVSALALKDGIMPEHGLWRCFVNLLVNLSPDNLPYILHLAGALSGAFSAAVMYLLLCMLYPLMFKLYTTELVRIRLLVDFLALGVVWMLALSEGFWNIFRFFTVQTSLLLLVMIVGLTLILFLTTSRIRHLLACYFITGLLAGGSALGIFLLLVVRFVFFVVKRRWCQRRFATVGGVGHSTTASPSDAISRPRMLLMNPLIVERLKTPCALAFLFGFLMCALTDVGFALHLPGASLGTVLKDSMLVYWVDLVSYADALDFVKVMLLVGLPLVANLWFCRQATDTETFLPRYLSCLYLVTALVAYTQLSGFSQLWFWTWPGSPLRPSSPLFLAVVSFCTVLVVATSLIVFVVDVCCRDFATIIHNLCPDSDAFQREADAVLGHAIAAGSHHILVVKGLGFMGLVLLLCALAVPSRRQEPQRAIMSAIHDFGVETAREAAGCGGYLVTNGALDDALFLRLYRMGSSVKIISAKEARDLEGEDAVRTGWMTDLLRCHFAGGWDFSGLVARRNNVVRDAAESRRRVRVLAERFVAMEQDGTLASTPDRFLKNAVCVIMWHLARVLNMQLQTCEEELSPVEVTNLERLVRELDRSNAALQRVLVRLGGDGTQSSVVLTPQEGLAIAINRSDLELARRYVDIVLDADPGNVLALYAQGMLLLKDERPVRAAAVLKRVAEKWPDEPAVLNNLAVALSRAGRREEACEWIRKAEAHPHAPEAVKANAAEIREGVK